MGKREPFAWDCNGVRIYAGDYVKCVTGAYVSIEIGQVKKVLAVDEGRNTITINNEMSPVGTSDYMAYNFRLVRRSACDKTQDKETPMGMLHVAIRIKDGEGYQDIARRINDHHAEIDADSVPDMMADTSPNALKERIKVRIRQYPNERWLILSGNTIAETSSPPVSFRQW